MSDDVERQLVTALRRESALAGVLNAVARGGDLESVLTEIAYWTAELTRSALGLVFVGEGEVVATYMGGPDREPTRGERPFGDDSALTKVLRNRVTLAFDDQSSIFEPGFAQSIEAAQHFGIRSSVFAPMRSEGPPVGVAAFRLTIDPFTADEIELLETFAAQAGNAVTNARLLADIEQRNAELAEALELQTATAEVLRLIGEHPGERDAVLQGILTKAAELTGGEAGSITLTEADGTLHYVASYGPAMEPYIGTSSPAGATAALRTLVAIRDDGTIHTDDFAELVRGHGDFLDELAHTGDVRSYAAAPLTRGTETAGHLHMYRHEVRAFSEQELSRLASFAAQASLAIGNAQLFNDLDAALERQTAMTDVLETVSTARFDLQPVFDIVTHHANRLCNGTGAGVVIRDGDRLRTVASTGALEQAIRGRLFDIDDTTPIGAAALTMLPIHIRDWDAVDSETYPNAASRQAGRKSALVVPMVRNGLAIGVIGFSRAEAGGYTDDEVSLLRAFASQAAIAVDNARLLAEIEERNTDLDAALERQTAMTDVLDAVSTARDDLRPVYDAVARHARKLCDGANVGLFVSEGDALVGVAGEGDVQLAIFEDESEAREFLIGRAWSIADDTPMAEACRTGRPVHIRDWDEVAPNLFRDTTMRGWGRRSTLSLPLLRTAEVVGVLNISNVEPGGYSDAEVALLQAFANQAAIAVDNARLLREIQERNSDLSESLQLQTATSEALRLISANPGELNTVLDGIVKRATALCDASFGNVMLRDGDILRFEAVTSGLGADEFVGMEFVVDDGNVNTTAAKTGEIVAVDDFHDLAPELAARLPFVRSWATVALFNERAWIGNLIIGRDEVRPFDADNLKALQVFADQASIAVANAQLFNDLDAALERQTAMTDVLDAVSTARDDLQPVFEAVVRHAHRLCGGATAALFLRDGDMLTAVGYEGMALDHARAFPVDAMSNPASEALCTSKVVHIRNWSEIAADRYPDSVLRGSGLLSAIQIPLLRHGETIGVLGFTRAEAGGFTIPEVEVLQAFADQASIAVDNARLLAEIEDRNADLSESLELQTATSDVLRLISAHPGELQVVLDGILAKAVALCEADSGAILVGNPELVRIEAFHGVGAEVVTGMETRPSPLTTEAAARHAPISIDDIRTIDDPVLGQFSEQYGIRSWATVALIHDGNWVGSVNVSRLEVRAFEPSQLAILQTFADQAAIAIANANLFNDLDRALERQTAMSDVLEAVSTARFDIQPVFDRIADHAQRLCDDTMAIVTVRDRSEMTIVAAAWPETRGELPEGDIHWDTIDTSTTTGTVFSTGQAVHVRDWNEVPADLYPDSQARNSGMRTLLTLPMRRHDEVIGAITFVRVEAGGYPDDQVSLLQAFTDQAAIAVDNARLLREIEERNTEIEERNTEISESLELQTATSEVLELISSNPGDLTTVLARIVDKAIGLCDAHGGSVLLRDGDVLRIEVVSGPDQHLIGREFPTELSGANLRARNTHAPVFVDDFQQARDPLAVAAAAESDLRSFASIALIQDDEWIGNLNLLRFEVRPFDPKVATILQAFADQAAIAVANAKLFNDLDAALERQTAMTEVLDAVSTSRLDMQPVFDAVAHHANRLCSGTGAAIFVKEGDELVISATSGMDDASELLDRIPIDPSSPAGESVISSSTVHITDLDQLEDRFPNSPARRSGRRSVLCIPMIRNDALLGVVAFSRFDPGGYSDAEISLLRTFTDQAAIAVDNARLLREIEERNSDLAESLELQTATSDVLGLISANPGDIDTVFTEVIERATRLCDGAYAAVWRDDGDNWTGVGFGEGWGSMIGFTMPSGTIIRAARRFDDVAEFVESVGWTGPPTRSTVQVPLLKGDGDLYGLLMVHRSEVRPFGQRDQDILQAFADQASIAIANADLFNDLDAALERQTAMTDVLGAVSTARFDLQPVFDRIVDHAQRLCHDVFAYVTLRDAEVTVVAAAGADMIGLHPQFENRPVPVDSNSTTGTVYATGEPLHIRDWDEVPADLYPNSRAREMGARSLLTLPMGRHGHVIGSIGYFRAAPGGYTDEEISLLQAFTDQAAIAVDNARLLREIEERNQDLSESLELQTATSEVLQLISANPGDLNIVLEGIITRAAAFCEAETGLLWLRHGDELRCVAQREARFSFVGNTTSLADSGANRRAGETKQPFFMDDLAAAVRPGMPLAEEILATGVRSFATIPLLRDGEWIGNINVGRFEVRPFDQKQAAILQAFADQAAIAVENARLFNDLDAALERQTAMTDVLDAVSQARLDLQPVFDKVAEHADRLCNGTGALVLVREGDELILSAIAGPMPMAPERVGEGRVPIDESSITGAAVARGEIIHIRDWDEESASAYADSPARRMGHQSALGDPDDARWRRHRRRRLHPGGLRRLRRRRDHPPGDVRRPGCDRGRQRPPAPRDRGTQHRTVRIPGAADSDLGDPSVDQRQPGQPRRGLPRHRDPGSAPVQCRHGRCHASRGGRIRSDRASDQRDQAEIGTRTPVPAGVDFREPVFIDDVAVVHPDDVDGRPEHRVGRDVRRRDPLRPDQRQPPRGPAVRTTPRPHRAGVRRAGGDRDLQRQPLHPARGTDPARRGGERRQGVVPGDDEPRDPHADERRDRHERTAARHRPSATPAGVRRDHPLQRRVTARHHQRHPRLLEDRRRSPGAGGQPVRPAGLRRVGVRPRHRARRPQGPGAGVPHRPGGPRRHLRRRHPAAPGDGQPARQRGEVHRDRRGRHDRRARRRDERDPPRGARHRHRHPRRSGAQTVRGVQPTRLVDHPQVRGHRVGPRGQQATRRTDGRHDVGRKRRW